MYCISGIALKTEKSDLDYYIFTFCKILSKDISSCISYNILIKYCATNFFFAFLVKCLVMQCKTVKDRIVCFCLKNKQTHWILDAAGTAQTFRIIFNTRCKILHILFWSKVVYILTKFQHPTIITNSLISCVSNPLINRFYYHLLIKGPDTHKIRLFVNT